MHNTLRTYVSLVLLGVAMCLAPVSSWSGGRAGYTLAVHPYLPIQEIHQRFDPLADYLAKSLGKPVTVRVGHDYEAHLGAIGRDRVDLAFVGPAVYVGLTQAYGPKPILGAFEVAGGARLRGVIAVRASDPAQTLGQIKGRYMAFGDIESTMSHLVPRLMLQEAGVRLEDLAGFRFLGSHSNVAMALLSGDFDAGAMKKEVFDEYAGKGLRALAVSQEVPDHLFVARADFPTGDIERLRRAFQNMHGDKAGRRVLSGLHKGLTRLVPARDQDYDGLRAMLRKLEPLRAAAQ